MGYLVDSHCHLHDQEFFTPEQAEKMLERARKNGVQKIVCIGTDPEDSLAAAEFAKAHEGVYWTYGIHPEHADKEPVRDESILSRNAPSDPLSLASAAPYFLSREIYSSKGCSHLGPIAIGEVGLDYHYEGYDRAAQIRLFEQMLQLAVDNDSPVSFHIREAFEDFFPIVANFPQIRGVVHSFTDSKKVLRRILKETEFYVGVNGLATYTTLATPPLERILLETDAPFLTPVPFRGIINEPGYIYNVAEWLSDKLGVEFETIERETTKNARELFRF